MQEDSFVRVLYKGRPIFHGSRDPRTGMQFCDKHEDCDGWTLDPTNGWFIEWDSQRHDLFPGRDAFVPWAAMVSAFGDPRSTDKLQSYRDQHGRVGFIPDRRTEIRRLRTKYDNMYGDESLVAHHPFVEVYELDGTPITTVLDDPQGRTTIPVEQTAAQQDELLEIVKRQQLTINTLMQKVGMTPQPTEATVPPPPEPQIIIPPDSPVYDELPEDETSLAPNSEKATGERGGRPSNEPGLDFATLNVES